MGKILGTIVVLSNLIPAAAIGCAIGYGVENAKANKDIAKIKTDSAYVLFDANAQRDIAKQKEELDKKKIEIQVIENDFNTGKVSLEYYMTKLDEFNSDKNALDERIETVNSDQFAVDYALTSENPNLVAFAKEYENAYPLAKNLGSAAFGLALLSIVPAVYDTQGISGAIELKDLFWMFD